MKLFLPIGNGQSMPVEIVKTTDEYMEIYSKYNKNLIAELKSLEGAQWVPEKKCWKVKDSERNWYSLNLLTNNIKNKYDEPLKIHPKVRDYLMKHQGLMVDHVLTYRQCHIAGQMRIGKTLSLIEVIDIIFQNEKLNDPHPCWIICPRSAINVWRQEFVKWKSPNEHKCRFLTYDSIPGILVRTTKFPYIIIFDESHKLKNPQAKRTEACRLLAAISRKHHKNPIQVCMTGTPSPNDPTDWWSQIEILCPGFLRESTKAKFAKRLGNYEERVRQDGGKYFELIDWNPFEIKLLKDRLKGMVLPLFKKDCLDLSPIIFSEIQLPISQSAMNAIKLKVNASGKGIETLIRLRQLSDGFAKVSDTEYQQITTPKDEALADLLEEIDSNRVVIFGAFHKTVDKLVEFVTNNGWEYIRLDGRGLVSSLRFQTDPINEWFQSDDPRKIAFIGNPDAGGLSINLNKSENIIYYSNSFKGDARSQSQERCHGIGTNKCTVTDLLWLPTDKYVLEKVRDKKSIESVTTGEIDEYINNFNYSYTELKENEN